MPCVCRDCRSNVTEPASRCSGCGSPRIVCHPELSHLAVAHIDCDAFYATVEKRDNPALEDQAVIVGGGRRGVVLTCCYIARTFGVRSAMPMFKARKLCPDAVIVRPNMAKYAEVGRQIRTLMRDLTPLVEPVSIDEAFMDLGGTERLHGMTAAQSLAGFAEKVENILQITVSVGLSSNKFLAKIASDLDKPRGFAVLGEAEAPAFLKAQSVSLIFGVGQVTQSRLARDGLRMIGDIQSAGEFEMARRYGAEGERLFRLAHGRDDRPVRSERETKSVSAETTFEHDIADFRALELRLWRLSERVSTRLKASGIAGATISLKLKTANFKTRTRAQSFEHPTQLAAKIFAAGRELLARETDGTAFRLIGIGVTALCDAARANLVDLLDHRITEAEHAVDKLRKRFGEAAVIRGLALDEQIQED